MGAKKPAVVLVGHGGVPKDYPREKVSELKRLERERQKTGGPPGEKEEALETELREWPRTPESDPYKAGLEALSEKLAPLLPEAELVLAYNEFCKPTLEQAVEDLAAKGFDPINVVPTMFTPGGSHSEIEIPEKLQDLRRRLPETTLNYSWPFDLEIVARMLSQQLQNSRVTGFND